MADPIIFCGTNMRLSAPEGGEDIIATLHTLSDGHEHISCWKLSPEELQHAIDNGGEVWVSIWSGKSSPPIKISGFPMVAAKDPDTDEAITYYTDGRHIVNDARQFATLHHGTQLYADGEPYSYHLGAVVDVITDFGLGWIYQSAGFLHDIEEDCFEDMSMDERRQLIANRYGGDVEALVWACTGTMFIDGVKQNRKARNKEQYAKIAALPVAALIKVADRIANMEACVKYRSSQGEMYRDEINDFDDNVGVHAPPEMRLRLLDAVRGIIEYAGESKKVTSKKIKAKMTEIEATIPAPPEA